uniref:Uncharacterized protein n=1 Tax=Siphoviridae sp. ctsUY14 TaxID=2825693 RepID=A0A8S5P5Y3_9CAUD|nr:MAG TPA: hypothetical protein [Siphoviridae sp. ctsUY14]
MIDAVLKLILAVLILSIIIFPIYVNLFKERLWEYVKQKLEEQEKHNKLVRNMKQRKKGNQGKSIIK